MFRLTVILLTFWSSNLHAEALAREAAPQILLQPVCPEGQVAYPHGAAPDAVCGPIERFGCPSDWILTTRGGMFESCHEKVRQPEPAGDALMVMPLEEFCGDGQVLYYRLDGPHCAAAFPDAGEPCDTALDCDGTCLATTEGNGACAAGPLGFGCTEFLGPDGKVATICID